MKYVRTCSLFVLLIGGLKSLEYDKFFKEYNNYENVVIWTMLQNAYISGLKGILKTDMA